MAARLGVDALPPCRVTTRVGAVQAAVVCRCGWRRVISQYLPGQLRPARTRAQLVELAQSAAVRHLTR